MLKTNIVEDVHTGILLLVEGDFMNCLGRKVQRNKAKLEEERYAAR